MKQKASSGIEEWRQCVDHPRFEVSDRGRVRRIKTGRIISAHTSRKGYACSVLWSGERMVTAIVHRLVAKAFVPNPSGYPTVNHIDADKGNNSAANLEWCTQAENIAHAKRMGLMPRGSAHGRSKLTPDGVRQIRSMRESGQTLDSIANSLAVSVATVRQVLLGKTWTSVPIPTPPAEEK